MWTSILEARSIYLRPRNSISFAEVSFNIFRNVLSSAKRLLSLPFIWRSQEVLHLLEQPQPTGLNLRREREKGKVAKAGVTQLDFVQFGQKTFGQPIIVALYWDEPFSLPVTFLDGFLCQVLRNSYSHFVHS